MASILLRYLVIYIFFCISIQNCLSAPSSKNDDSKKNSNYKERESKTDIQSLEGTLGLDANLEDLAEEALNTQWKSNGVIFPKTDKLVNDIAPEDDMEAAETMVFRPLFRYKKQNVEKRRINRDGNHSESQTSKPVTPSRSPPGVLVYDRKTGSYYPAPSSYSGYYPGAIPYRQ